MKRLVLVGGGHAHLSVLAAFANYALANIEIVLVTPSTHQNYSGMLPGWMSGHYRQSECQIDLRHLAAAAGVRLELAYIVGMDADRCCIGLPDGRHLEYDVISIDVGSDIDVSWLEMAGKRLLPVKPLDHFFEMWPQILTQARRQPNLGVVIVGGGAAGVELSLAAQFSLRQVQVNSRVELVTSSAGLLAGHSSLVRKRVTNMLLKADIRIHNQRAVGVENGVMLTNGTHLAADYVIAATGTRAPCWLQPANLALDEDGYIAVDQYHRSLSHPNVFAAGDVCSRQDVKLVRSGVHAVHAGPVLAKNLYSMLKGGGMVSYRPRRSSLYLLACGPRYAVASWGRFSLEGKWVWYWKDWIDRRFIKRFSSQPSSA